MSDALTVADSKRAFHSAFPFLVAPLYRRMVDELLVELHLLSRQQGFQSDPLFACGLIQVFDGFTRGYRPDHHRELLLAALCSCSGHDAAALRRQRDEAVAAIGHHSVEEVKQWVERQGEGAPEPLALALASIRRPDFHYSRLMAVGLLSLMEQAQGADGMDPLSLRGYAHDLGSAMGLLRERLDRDLSLYVTNLEKMAQAVELMEETVAAERRKRERRQQPPKAEQPADTASESGGDSGGGDQLPAPAAEGVQSAG